MRAANKRRRRLVKADMTVMADTEQLQIELTDLSEKLVVPLAFQLRVRCAAARDMCLLRCDIDVAEQIIAHVAGVALGMLRRQTDIFIKIEGGSPLIADEPLLIVADHLLIN